MYKMITKERRWQQVIVLLFLFLLGWPVVGWAQRQQGSGTKEDPFTGLCGERTLSSGTYYVHNITSEYGLNRFIVENNAEVKLIISGSNDISHSPGFQLPSSSKLTISGTGSLYLYGTNSVAIGSGDHSKGCGSLILEGAVCLNCEWGYVGKYIEETADRGKLTLKDGAIFISRNSAMTKEYAAEMIVENFAFVKLPTDGNPLGEANGCSVNYGDIGGVTSYATLTVNGVEYENNNIHYLNYQKPPVFYFNPLPDYIELTDKDNIKIPASPKQGKEVRLGAAIMTNGTTNYPSLFATFMNDITLNVTNYPYHNGILVAGAPITFSGGGNILKTITGLELDATKHPLYLSGISCPAGNTLIITGKVHKDASSKIGNGVTVDVDDETFVTTAVYYCTTSIPVGTISNVTCNGQRITNYYQNGSDFCMWLPAGDNKVVMETDKGGAYTYTGYIEAQQDQNLVVYADRFNINISSLTLTTATSGNQSIAYNGETYNSPPATPLTVWGKAGGNNITLQGGATGNMTLEGVSMSGNPLPLTVTRNTAANITIEGTNSLTSSGNDAIKVDDGSTLNLLGTGSLAVSATNASFKDINNLGTMSLSGSFSLNAANSKFPPNAAIAELSKVKVKVKLGGVTYYRACMNGYTSVEELLNAEGNALNTNLYYNGSALENKFWFWMKDGNPKITFKATKGGMTSIYMLPPLSKPLSEHNTELTPLPLVAAIGDTYYKTLAEAFAAVTAGKVIELKADCVLPNNTTATLSQLTRGGEVATLDLGAFKLTGNTNTTLSGGPKRGTLKIISSSDKGSLAGSFILDGCVYTDLPLSNVSFQQGGQAVYRMKTTGFPGGTGQQVTYRSSLTGSAEYDAWRDDVWGACLWLPAGSQTLRLSSVRDTENESVATAAPTVVGNHMNALTTLSPLVDVGYGDVNIMAGNGNATTLSCGRQPYVWTLNGLFASKRLTISGQSTTTNITVMGTETAWLTLDQVNIKPDVNKAALVVAGGAKADFELSGKSYLYGGYGGYGGAAGCVGRECCIARAPLCRRDGQPVYEGHVAGYNEQQRGDSGGHRWPALGRRRHADGSAWQCPVGGESRECGRRWPGAGESR